MQSELNRSAVKGHATKSEHPLSGIVFLDKPYGWSSRQAVNELIRLFSRPGCKRIKAGHAGTLDPLATGMLPILLGEATRYAELGLTADKSYRVTFDLSYQSDTLDCEGAITGRFTEAVSCEQLETALAAYHGLIQQVPPAYSAIRIDGKRAHALARQGEEVLIPARPVTIHRIKLLNFDTPLVTLEVECSKGTYIRSLARDIGESLGVGGCVTALRRLSTGGWPEAMMVTQDQLQAQPDGSVLPLAQWLRDMPSLPLSTALAIRFLQGQRIQLDQGADYPQVTADQLLVSVYSEHILLGTGMLKAGHHRAVLHPARILPSAQRSFI
ncbi:MAG: tRNA pseudouridine(55) synthase TruB [Mariprofundus sp.]|nr:tRNA pseudouridine(55) synthase TruB [Mariprofundus sp.]